jgi:hypothetical protein
MPDIYFLGLGSLGDSISLAARRVPTLAAESAVTLANAMPDICDVRTPSKD